MVNEFLKTNLKSTYGYSLDSSLVSSLFILEYWNVWGRDTYINIFGTEGVLKIGMKISVKNFLNTLSKI